MKNDVIPKSRKNLVSDNAHSDRFQFLLTIPMSHVLIVESDLPAMERSLEAAGKITSAGCYARAFQTISDDISFDITRPYASDYEPVSVDFEAYDGVAFTGSSVTWSVDAPQALPLRQTMEAALKAQIPVFGSCNGMQLAAVVLGGECRAAPAGMELGLARNITLNSAGRRHPMHCGRAERFCVLSIHRDQVSKLPDGAIVTAANEHSSVQAMVYEQASVRFWGTQYHPEYSFANIVDNASETNSVFYKEREKLNDLQSGKQTSAGEFVKKQRTSVNDMNPLIRQTELRNWLTSLK